MPPRKSDPPRDDTMDDSALTIEDLTLPKSIITRLAKGVLPPNTQIQANAVLALSKSATVFVNYLASHANEYTTLAGKKTIAPADVFKALDDIEFGFLKGPLEAEFARFNKLQTEKRNSYRQKVRAKEEQGQSQPDSKEGTSATAAGASAAAPKAKKPRVNAPQENEDEEQQQDAETEDEVDVQEEEEDENEDEDEGEDDEDGDVESEDVGDETQDALEDEAASEKGKGADKEHDGDEALGGDESD
ncbi:Histone-fold protein [Moelleriella libera RCEF 2490]|uniref:DNA polymerase epsilon subunit D n=1 Tax=Moelleriella libera RCEF 2490 TaxID=1081109 RepID=A0A168C0X5_9HYPO|nr:Histone-fold protein [Moelleriella libera RCEF 2490]